jgi:hypothetical protein
MRVYSSPHQGTGKSDDIPQYQTVERALEPESGLNHHRIKQSIGMRISRAGNSNVCIAPPLRLRPEGSAGAHQVKKRQAHVTYTSAQKNRAVVRCYVASAQAGGE